MLSRSFAITTIGIALSYAAPYVNGKFLDFLLANRSEKDAVLFALLVASIGVFLPIFIFCRNVIYPYIHKAFF